MSVLLSVIVPIFNTGNYLQKCVNSLINQTYQDIEILLIDDGSTDNSGYICDELALSDSRIRVVHKKNGGLGDARNYGLDICSGEYVSFVDPDDWIEKNSYEKLIQALDNSGSDIAIGDMIIYYSADRISYNPSKPLVMNNYEAMYFHLNRNYICNNSACNKIYRREILVDLQFPVEKKFEDTFFMHNVISKCSKVINTGIPFYYHFQRDGSITHQDFNYWHVDLVDAYREKLLFIMQRYPQLVPYARAKLVQASLDFINCSLFSKSNQYREIRKNVYKELKQQPVLTILIHKNTVGSIKSVILHLLIKISVPLYEFLYQIKSELFV